MSCEEFNNAIQKLKNSNLSEDDKKFVDEAKIYKLKSAAWYPEYYLWKEDNAISYHRSYDSVYDTITMRSYDAPTKVGKRKLEKKIYIQGLPGNCFQ